MVISSYDTKPVGKMAGPSLIDHMRCFWRLDQDRVVADVMKNPRCWCSVDLAFVVSTPGPYLKDWNEVDSRVKESILSQSHHSSDAFTFVRDACSLLGTRYTATGVVVKLILPTIAGHLVRTDILSIRMKNCPGIEDVSTFIPDHRQLPAFESTSCTAHPILEILDRAIAGITLKPVDAHEQALQDLDSELQRRLSFLFIQPGLHQRRTLAMLKGTNNRPERGGTGSGTLAAAKVLGIDLIVLDKVDHFLREPRYADSYREFLVIDMTRDEGLPSRVVDALRRWGGHLDGLTTHEETISNYAAEAALMLGLPAPPPDALRRAADKYETSKLDGRSCFLIGSHKDIADLAQHPSLSFPLIVKPCAGYSSQGVSLVNNIQQLGQAYNHAMKVNQNITRIREMTCCVESYCDGPELDINFIMSRGKMKFFEVSDDFPKSADGNHESVGSNFIEYANVLPSKLPSEELHLLEESLHNVMLGLGIYDGVYHLEARMQHSSMNYYTSTVDAYQTNQALMDLHLSTNPPIQKPRAFLIEINARPPGKPESDAVESTYGIDYIGLSLLTPLLDHTRIDALSIPFVNRTQYWCAMVFIQTPQLGRDGIFNSDDVVEDLKRRRPDLGTHITKSFTFHQRGDVIPDAVNSGKTTWIAYVDVFSRISRRHVLEIAEEVRKEIRFEIL